MKQAMFTITKDRLEDMRISEKAEYLEHMLADMWDAEIVSFIVIGHLKEDLNSEEIVLNVEEV
mgnify:FL=1